MEKLKAVDCFIEYDNKFLILLRPQTRARNSEWGLVGGKIDQGESPEQAVIREIAEEISFEVPEKDLEFIGNFILKYPDNDWDFSVYRIKLKQLISLKLDDQECLDFKWVTPQECFSIPNLMQGLYFLLKEVGYINDGHLS